MCSHTLPFFVQSASLEDTYADQRKNCHEKQIALPDSGDSGKDEL